VREWTILFVDLPEPNHQFGRWSARCDNSTSCVDDQQAAASVSTVWTQDYALDFMAC